MANNYDVIIAGSGAAGLYAAINLPKELKILIVAKRELTLCNSALAQGGIAGITFPIVSDINKTISASYGVLAGETSMDADGNPKAKGELVAYRGLFLIDKEGIIQHEVVNNFPLGRSTEEELRMVDALQHFEQFGEVCPMNWHKGEKAMKPDAKSTGEYLASK